MAFSSLFKRSISTGVLHSFRPLPLALCPHRWLRPLAFILSDIPPLNVPTAVKAVGEPSPLYHCYQRKKFVAASGSENSTIDTGRNVRMLRLWRFRNAPRGGCIEALTARCAARRTIA
jgi:hypothetical protein